MSTTITAKVFKAGNSKALRLPRGLDVEDRQRAARAARRPSRSDRDE